MSLMNGGSALVVHTLSLADQGIGVFQCGILLKTKFLKVIISFKLTTKDQLNVNTKQPLAEKMLRSCRHFIGNEVLQKANFLFPLPVLTQSQVHPDGYGDTYYVML